MALPDELLATVLRRPCSMEKALKTKVREHEASLKARVDCGGSKGTRELNENAVLWRPQDTRETKAGLVA